MTTVVDDSTIDFHLNVHRCTSMSKKPTDARYQLGEPLAGDLQDFCAAHYNAPASDIIRTALREFIDARLAVEPEMRKRYEAARKARLAGGNDKIRLLPKAGD